MAPHRSMSRRFLHASIICLTLICRLAPVRGTFVGPLSPTSYCVALNNGHIFPGPVQAPSPDMSGINSETFTKASRTSCAMLSSSKRALGFDFSGNTCTLYGAGENDQLSRHDVWSIPSFPPLGDLEEVAFNKVSYAPGPVADEAPARYYPPSMANDGIQSFEDSRNMYHSSWTDLRWHPFWLVDLKEMRMVHQVQFDSRTDCCTSRIHDFEFRVGRSLVLDGDLSSYTLMSYYKGPYSPSHGIVVCSGNKGIYGRFVSIQAMTDDINEALMLAEVKVFALKN